MHASRIKIMALSSTDTRKLKNKECINRIRYDMPKLHEVLREKCRQKMRERRNQLFNQHRFRAGFDAEHTQSTLTAIIREELKNLTTSDWHGNTSDDLVTIDEPLSQEEAIELESEIIQEQEQWILQEYEKMSQGEIEFLAMYADNNASEVFCPICQKAILSEENNCVFCTTCELRLTGCTIQKVGYLTNESVRVHAFGCAKIPVFIVISDNSNINLYLMCQECSTLALIC